MYPRYIRNEYAAPMRSTDEDRGINLSGNGRIDMVQMDRAEWHRLEAIKGAFGIDSWRRKVRTECHWLSEREG